MVDQIDTTYPITITRLLVEGDLEITSVIAPSELVPGALFDIQIFFTNHGGDDACFIWVKDADSGGYYHRNGRFDAPGYSLLNVTITDFLMPNKDLNLLIEAGHVV